MSQQLSEKYGIKFDKRIIALSVLSRNTFLVEFNKQKQIKSDLIFIMNEDWEWALFGFK